MSFEANPFHSETVIAQSGHTQESKWHWVLFFFPVPYCSCIVQPDFRYLSFNLEIAKLIETWQSV